MQQSWVRIPAVTPTKFKMITIVENSNICDVTEGVILHGVNCQGVMGSGVAKQLRDKYPEIFIKYYAKYKIFEKYPQKLLGSVVPVSVSDDLEIWNCFTQLYYGKDGIKYASYDALDSCLKSVRDSIPEYEPIHIPYLIGAGLGGLKESIVLAMIEELLAEKTVYLHKFKK